MRRLALTVVILGILALHDASSAIAASSLSDFEQGMKKIERKLCSKLPSSRCRLARPARKAAVTGVPRLPQKELPVKLKPVQIVPTEPPTQIMPEAPAAPASSITVKPPNRTSPINKLKPAGNTQPNQATPIVLPPAPVLKIATPPPSLPVEEPAKPSKRATVGVLPGVPPALNPVKPVFKRLRHHSPPLRLWLQQNQHQMLLRQLRRQPQYRSQTLLASLHFPNWGQALHQCPSPAVQPLVKFKRRCSCTALPPRQDL